MSAFTEKAIVDAFVSLLNEHPLDKITVKNMNHGRTELKKPCLLL